MTVKFNWVLLFVPLLVASCAAAQAPEVPQVSLPGTYTDHGVRIEVSGLSMDGYGHAQGVSGLATNVTDRDMVTCMITLDVLDASGTKVSSVLASTTGLKSGQSWRFQGTFMNPFSVGFSTIEPGQILVMYAH